MRRVSIVWEFPKQGVRFVNVDHGGLNHGASEVFVGAIVGDEEGSSLAVDDFSITVGRTEFTIPDVGGAISAFVRDHDADLYGSPVIRKIGFEGEDETGYSVSRWIVDDYGAAGKRGGGYLFVLANVFGPMTRGLYEDLSSGDGGSRIVQLSADVLAADDEIPISSKVDGVWREPGFVVLWREETRTLELVRYTSISATGYVLLGCERAYYGTAGATARDFQKDGTEIFPVWVARGNPLDLVLRWLLTTDDGSNGVHDAGDGDGLGAWIKPENIDVAGIEALRDRLWPVPSGWNADGTPIDGTAVLFVEREPIDDVKDWIEKHVLAPFGLFPVIDANERFSVVSQFEAAPQTVEIVKEWRIDDFDVSRWRRNLAKRRNNLSILADWNPAEGEHLYRRSRLQGTSLARYGKAKAEEIASRGGRTGKAGFPDYGSAGDLSKASSRVFLESANPWTEIGVRAFFRFRDLALGSAVRITIPGVPDVARGVLGIERGSFIVTKRRVDWEKGFVDLSLRLRRPIARPGFIAPNSIVSTYSTATESEREFAFVTPDDATSFPNGDPAYTVIP